MWAIRDSDGAETLHSIYPGWADSIDHLTVIPLVPKAAYDAVVKELEEAQKQLAVSAKLAARHMQTMKENGSRMRDVEAANNRYYGLLQRYNLIGTLPGIDDTPLIDVKV
jgi:hypothetical protein